MFIYQEVEGNIVDQRKIEYGLWDHGVPLTNPPQNPPRNIPQKPVLEQDQPTSFDFYV